MDRYGRYGWMGLIILILGGCSTTPPPEPDRKISLPNPKTWDMDVRLQTIFAPLTHNTTEIANFLQQVLDHNPNLQAISATVQAVDSLAQTERSAHQPRLEAGLSAQKNSDVTENITTINATISWTVDLWGKLADLAQAANLHVAQQKHLLNQAKRAMIAEALHAWIDLWQIRRQTENLAAQHKIADFLAIAAQESYRSGLGTYEQVTTLQDNLKSLEIAQEKTRLQEQRILHRLNLLRGQEPDASLMIQASELSAFLVPIPKQIDSRSILERPDVQAAYAELQMLDAQTRAAHKALLPQITLSGTIERGGGTLANILSGKNIWQLVGGLTQPIFNGGELESLAEQKSHEAKSAFWRYRQTVLSALQEVEDALASEISLSHQQELQMIRLNSRQHQLESLKERYLSGQTELSEYLEMQAQLLQLQSEHEAFQSDQLHNRVTLALSLGLALETHMKEQS